MVAIKQYPHSISVILATIPVQDEAGNPVIPEGSEFTSKCRAEKLKSNPTTQGVDGAQLAYQFDVFLPKMAVVIPFGSKAVITVGEGLFYEGVVKSHVINQLNSRMQVDCNYSGLAG